MSRGPLVVVFIVVVLIFSGLAYGFNCTGRSDGIYEASCQSAIKCTSGTDTRIDCTIPKVVNEETGDCDNALDVNTPCGVFRDCSARDDGAYPDLETKCLWYYICSYGVLYGHQKCATGLVWNTRLQTCDFPYNVYPPCGTKH